MTQQLNFQAFTQKNEDLCSHKTLYMNVYSSFICNSKKLKRAQMFFNRWLVKQIIHADQETLLSNKEEWTIDTAISGMDLQRIMLRENANPQRFYTAWFYLQNSLETDEKLVVARGQGERVFRGTGEILLLIEAIYISSYGNINILVTLDSFARGMGKFSIFLKPGYESIKISKGQWLCKFTLHIPNWKDYLRMGFIEVLPSGRGAGEMRGMCPVVSSLGVWVMQTQPRTTMGNHSFPVSDKNPT